MIRWIIGVIVVGMVAFFCAPIRQVVNVTVNLPDEPGAPVSRELIVRFLDAQAQVLVEMPAASIIRQVRAIIVWEQKYGFAHSVEHARGIEIQSRECTPQRQPIILKKQIVEPSLVPHGGGPTTVVFSGTATFSFLCS